MYILHWISRLEVPEQALDGIPLRIEIGDEGKLVICDVSGHIWHIILLDYS